MPKPNAQVIDEYRSAESPDEWLVAEIADYFFDDVADPAERACEATDLLLNNEDALVDLAVDAYEPGDLIASAVRITGSAGDPVDLMVFRSMPGPVSLLALCADQCREGDQIHVEHLYADGQHTSFTNSWPFQMADAVLMTNPACRDMTAATLVEHDWQMTDGRGPRITKRAVAAVVSVAAAAATAVVLRRR